MHGLLDRSIGSFVKENLNIFPAVAILGPRQCGKSTLVKMLYKNSDAYLYIDLQNLEDLNKLKEPLLFFRANQDVTICLDEIQLAPQLFSILRSEIDRYRHPGRFILLGSASQDLIQKHQSRWPEESVLLSLRPLQLQKQNKTHLLIYIPFGFVEGIPTVSWQYQTGKVCFGENFLRTYVERDIPQLGFQIPALQLRRLLTMCAHSQGQLLNSSRLGESLGVTYQTVRRYIDLMEQTFVIRSLPPFEKTLKNVLLSLPKSMCETAGCYIDCSR